MFVTVELLLGSQGKRERKEDGRASTISYVTSVQVEDITIGIESCSIMGVGGKG
jgi:hypothetical protein